MEILKPLLSHMALISCLKSGSPCDILALHNLFVSPDTKYS